MATIPFQTAFGKHRVVNLDFDFDIDPPMTKQCHKDECDINKIMAQYQKSQILEHVNTYEGQYGDFMHAADYHTAMNQVRDAEDAFMSLPSEIRAEFDNEPFKFLAFAQDEKNHSKMVEMGLIVEPVFNVNVEAAKAASSPDSKGVSSDS